MSNRTQVQTMLALSHKCTSSWWGPKHLKSSTMAFSNAQLLKELLTLVRKRGVIAGKRYISLGLFEAVDSNTFGAWVSKRAAV